MASSACFDSLAAHLGELGITGQGLETAAQGSPLVGPFIGVHIPPRTGLAVACFHAKPCLVSFALHMTLALIWHHLPSL